MKSTEKDSLIKQQKKELDHIIEEKSVYPVFQPIVNLLNGEVHGYEALTRIKTPDCISNPEELFDIALRYGRTWHLEKLCRKKIISRYAELDDNMKRGKLFINVNPMVIMDESFKADFTRKQLEKFGISPEKIVIEITEKKSIENIDEFTKAVKHYKKQGYQIAIDDIGSCYAGLNVVCNTHPHYLKVDIQLIRNIDKDPMKYALVKGLVEIANYSSMNILAEGIETREELNTLLKLGVVYGQGFYLGKPKMNLTDTNEIAKENIKKYWNCKHEIEISNKEYNIVTISFSDYKAYEEYVRIYGEEKAKQISDMLFRIVKKVLLESEVMKAISEVMCIAIIEKSRCSKALELINNCFSNEIVGFYDEETLNMGYTQRETKKGKLKTVSLLSLKMTEDIIL